MTGGSGDLRVDRALSPDHFEILKALMRGHSLLQRGGDWYLSMPARKRKRVKSAAVRELVNRGLVERAAGVVHVSELGLELLTEKQTEMNLDLVAGISGLDTERENDRQTTEGKPGRLNT